MYLESLKNFKNRNKDMIIFVHTTYIIQYMYMYLIPRSVYEHASIKYIIIVV